MFQKSKKNFDYTMQLYYYANLSSQYDNIDITF